ncbi:Sulfhydrogenase 1 subunit alpha [uncultured archaeon]|nr:Sulfhydrogenase 1 subunit alpha [uncultured archaeon]
MHKDDDEEIITLENISKIEGHGSLDIRIKDKKVKEVTLKITESKRFYTQAIRGKMALSLPVQTSRICGTCSIAHFTACSEAVENAIKYAISDQTMLLRKLAVYSMFIRDHALHLYLFSLPDYMGKDSVLDFDESQNDLIRKAFAIKAAGNNMSKVIAGRAVHMTYAEVGRFSKVPDAAEIRKTIDELKSVRDYVIDFTEIFYASDFKLERDTDFVSLVTSDYSFVDPGRIRDTRGADIDENRYKDFLDKVVIPYSEATGYSFEGREFMVGALARMNLNKENLHRDTRRDMAKYIAAFPSKNIYRNNLAQSIELLHSIDHSIEILESNAFAPETVPAPVVKEGNGVGVIEAPRGTLYYMVSIDKTGKVQYGSIIVPTQQNQICMERTVRDTVEQNIGKDKHAIEHEIEKMIRAYDPCMSCASHFLRINWHGI